MKAGAIVGLIFTLVFTIIMANYTYNSWQHGKEVTAECLQTKNDYIAQYGAVPKEYEHMCDSTFNMFGGNGK